MFHGESKPAKRGRSNKTFVGPRRCVAATVSHWLLVRSFARPLFAGAFVVFAVGASTTNIASTGEGGVSFRVPGFFGSLAATPQQPGCSRRRSAITPMYRRAALPRSPGKSRSAIQSDTQRQHQRQRGCKSRHRDFGPQRRVCNAVRLYSSISDRTVRHPTGLKSEASGPARACPCRTRCSAPLSIAAPGTWRIKARPR